MTWFWLVSVLGYVDRLEGKDLVVETRIERMKTLGYIVGYHDISSENYGNGKMLEDWMVLKESKVCVEIVSDWMN